MKDLIHWIVRVQKQYQATISFDASAMEGFTIVYFKTRKSIDALSFHTDSINDEAAILMETVEQKLKGMQ